MKKIFLIIFSLLLFLQTAFAQITAKVDEKFELVSVSFALAGVPQFCDCGVPSYWKDIDVFIPYELTEPIHFVRKLHQEHYISFDAVSTAACMLEIKNGKIRLNPKYKIEQIAEFDKRWTPELFAEYIKQLNVFYKQSNFHKFYTNHKDLYAIAEQRMNEHIKKTATDWFESFFGKAYDPNIKVYISMVNGPHNYAMPEGILLGMGSDNEGIPAANASTMSLLIHEIGHHYTNPLFDNYWEQMKDAAEKIYPHVQEQMFKNAYGNARTTMVEWLNNLFVLMYFKENNGNTSDLIDSNMNRGFIWMQRSYDFMDNFYANRDVYPTIGDFMPRIVGFLNFTADNFDLVQREFDQRGAYITNIYPAPGTDITNATEITLTFSERMNGSYGFYGWPEGTLCLPILDDIEEMVKWSDDNMKATIKLIPGKMEKGKTYGIRLSNRGFQTAKHYSLSEKSCDIIFNIPE